jgi:hypothetical protein
MESDYSQDLPAEILDKLRNLELELEDGDITLKGFEKKKASLLADISSNPSSPISPTQQQKYETELLDELGPEPSAADVVDFLDFLPSPTHSPTRRVEAVNLMEENHRQIQQQQQHQQQQPQPHHPQQQYQPLPQHQQQQIRPMQPQQYRPYPGNNGGMGRGNNGPYYNNIPVPNNRPYMVPRNNGYPQTSQQQPQMRPMLPPGANPYYGQRPPPPPSSQYRPQQPPRPPQQQQPTTSPRLMYRPQPRPNGGYRPQQQPQYTQSPVGQPQYGNYGYNNAGSVNRSLSTNSGTSHNNIQHQRPYNSTYTPRNDSMEWNQ